MYGSWLMFFCAAITSICLLCGTGCYWHYYTNESAPGTRKWAMGLFSAAPFFAIGGFAGYFILSFSFQQWLTEYAISGSQMTLSFTSVCCGFVCLLTLLPLIMVASCGKQEMGEYFY